MGRKYVLCDIDHTLSNAFGRDQLIGGPGGWDAYHAASINDEPLHDIVQLIVALHRAGAIVIGLTARPAKWRKLTMEWLLKHNIPLDEILMRPDEAYHPAPEIKLALAQQRFKVLQDEIAFVLDDRDDVVAAFKAQGVTALQVHGREK